MNLYSCFEHWYKNGTVWLYSDPHFEDKDMQEYFNYTSPEVQIKNINKKAGKNDTIVILGDVGNINWVRELKAYKVLITGNHDKGRTNYERIRKRVVLDKDKYTKEQIIEYIKEKYPDYSFCIYEGFNISHSPFTYFDIRLDNDLFDEVYTGPLFIDDKIILSHEPVDIPFAFNFHGHTHSKINNDNSHFNCCANVINYTPVNLNKLLKDGIAKDVKNIHKYFRREEENKNGI